MYDLLIRADFSLSARLNRIVVLSKVKDAHLALQELSVLSKNHPKILTHTYFAIKAELEIQVGEINCAVQSMKKAIELANNQIETKFLRKKLQSFLN